MSEKKEEEKPAEGEAPKKKSKKMLFIIIGVVVLILGAGVPMFLMGGEKPKEGEEAEQVEEVKQLEIAELGTFVVNLSESSSFLKVNLKVEYDAAVITKLEHQVHDKGGEASGGGHSGGGEAKGGLPPLFTKREPMIRDAIIKVLSSKTVNQVLTLEGKELIKEELLEGINEALSTEEPVVTAIYFNEFIIQ